MKVAKLFSTVLSRRALVRGVAAISLAALAGCGSDSFGGEAIDYGYDLSFLKVSVGTLAPSFLSSKVSYTVSVANSISQITFTPTVSTPSATVQINGISAVPGSASNPLSLVVGANTVKIVVTAPDTFAQKTYTVVVTRAAS